MKLKEYDIAEHLSSEEEMRMYLREIQKNGDASLVRTAQEDIANARSILQKPDDSDTNAG